MRIAIYGTGAVCISLLGEIDTYNKVMDALWQGIDPFSTRIEIACFAETVVKNPEFCGKKVVAGSNLEPDDFDYLIVASKKYDQIVSGLRMSNTAFAQFEERIRRFDSMHFDLRETLEKIQSLADSKDDSVQDNRERTFRIFASDMEIRDNSLSRTRTVTTTRTTRTATAPSNNSSSHGTTTAPGQSQESKTKGTFGGKR